MPRLCARSVIKSRKAPVVATKPAQAVPEPASWYSGMLAMQVSVFIVGFLALLLLALLVYAPSLQYGFVVDDHGQILKNLRVQNPGFVLSYFTQDVWGSAPGTSTNYYRPLFLLWLRLQYLLFGLAPAGWHFGSIAAHLMTTLLLGVLVYQLLRDRAATLLAVALFALHPAHVESVAWVSAVPDPLMSSALLVSLLLFMRWEGLLRKEPEMPEANRRKERSRHTRGNAESGNSGQASAMWLITSLLCFAIALLNKEPAAMLPALIFSLAMLKNKKTTGCLVRSSVIVLPYVAITAIYLLARKAVIGDLLGATMKHYSIRSQLLSLPAMLWFYVKALIWPVESKAFADSPMTDAWSFSHVLVPLALLLLVFTLGAFTLRWMLGSNGAPRSKAVRAAIWSGVLLLVIPILPVLDAGALVKGDVLHGRYVYLPSAGLALLLATAWHLLQKQQAKSILLVMAGVLFLCSAAFTFRQEGAWRNDLTVWQSAYEVAPNNAEVLYHLAAELVRARRIPEALPISREWTVHDPENWRSWATAGECYMKLGRMRDAEPLLSHAHDLNHDDARLNWELQSVRMQVGR